jgi:AcrR family transcriptional regulator
MPPRRRLTPSARRDLLLDVAEGLFAQEGYDEVRMERIASAASVSRALLYQHFPTKRELFAAVYQRAAERLLDATVLDPDLPLPDQVRAGLDEHFDYFEANRRTVLDANRTLSGDPVIQAIITEELSVLRDRMLAVVGLAGPQRATATTVLMGWLVFVRVLSVEWLVEPSCTRDELREICTSALLGALGPVLGGDSP